MISSCDVPMFAWIGFECLRTDETRQKKISNMGDICKQIICIFLTFQPVRAPNMDSGGN